MSIASAVAAVQRFGGVARTRTLVRAGEAKSSLAAAVGSGALVRPRQGVYASPNVAPEILESLSHRGRIACTTAGRAYGLWILDDQLDRCHTWVHRDHHPTRLALPLDPTETGCCVFHRDTPLDQPSLTSVGMLHCLVQLLACRGEECFFAALESALRRRLVDRRGVARLRSRIPACHRWLVDLARPDADSGLESLLRLRLHRAGVELRCQVAIPGVGVVDFVVGDCLILEADGGTHDGPTRHTDRVRDAAAAALGFTTLRFDYALIVHDWPLVQAAILTTIQRGAHRSRAGLTW